MSITLAITPKSQITFTFSVKPIGQAVIFVFRLDFSDSRNSQYLPLVF
jgi:hypothetical protein